jgi:hypothetical protein
MPASWGLDAMIYYVEGKKVCRPIGEDWGEDIGVWQSEEKISEEKGTQTPRDKLVSYDTS